MTARPIRRNAQTPDRNGKIFYTSTTSLSHISKQWMAVCIIRIVLTGIFSYQATDHLIQMIFRDNLTDHNECSDSETGTPVSFYLRHRNLSIRKIFQEVGIRIHRL